MKGGGKKKGGAEGEEADWHLAAKTRESVWLSSVSFFLLLPSSPSSHFSFFCGPLPLPLLPLSLACACFSRVCVCSLTFAFFFLLFTLFCGCLAGFVIFIFLFISVRVRSAYEKTKQRKIKEVTLPCKGKVEQVGDGEGWREFNE
jgi:cellulose synthase/poly-beta-1,6-N-acetylglucosamine synthase-like glycosyltransferase